MIHRVSGKSCVTNLVCLARLLSELWLTDMRVFCEISKQKDQPPCMEISNSEVAILVFDRWVFMF